MKKQTMMIQKKKRQKAKKQMMKKLKKTTTKKNHGKTDEETEEDDEGKPWKPEVKVKSLQVRDYAPDLAVLEETNNKIIYVSIYIKRKT